jgi:hypothetical protein
MLLVTVYSGETWSKLQCDKRNCCDASQLRWKFYGLGDTGHVFFTH